MCVSLNAKYCEQHVNFILKIMKNVAEVMLTSRLLAPKEILYKQ